MTRRKPKTKTLAPTVSGLGVRLLATLVVLTTTAAAAPQQPRDASPGDFGQPSGTARLSGRIIASDTGRPLKNARIILAAQGVRSRMSGMTDDAGLYQIADLPAARYTLTVSKAGYLTIQYGQRRPRQPGTLITLDDGQDLRNVNLTLPRGSVVTGRIMDEDGLPLPLARVQVFRYVYAQGDRQLAPAGADATDDRGVYRIFDLEPGDYFVSATVPRGFLAAYLAGVERRVEAVGGAGRGAATALRIESGAAAGGPMEIMAGLERADDPESMGYAPTYYPGVTNLEQAVRVSVGLSQEVSAVDFGVQLVPTASVSGIVFGPDGTGGGPGQVMLVPPEGRIGMRGMPLGGPIRPDGSFSINNVPPGRYIVRAQARGVGFARRGAAERLFATQDISVDGRDITDLTLILSSGVTVEGLMTFEGNVQPQTSELGRARVTAPALGPELPLDGGGAVGVNEDGTFALRGVGPGPRLVRVGNLPPDWTLKAVYFDGREVTDTGVDFSGVQQASGLHLVLTDRVSELSGAVHDGQGEPLTDVTIVVFPSDAALWLPRSRFIKASRPDQNGQYRIRDLPPGDYLLAAVEFVEQGQWFDPNFLESQRSAATRLSLREGETKSMNLTATAAAR